MAFANICGTSILGKKCRRPRRKPFKIRPPPVQERIQTFPLSLSLSLFFPFSRLIKFSHFASSEEIRAFTFAGEREERDEDRDARGERACRGFAEEAR